MFGSLTKLFSTFGKYADTFGKIAEGVSTIKSYMEDRAAEKATKRANENMMRAAQEEAALAKEDAAQRSEAARRDANMFRQTQIANYLKSGVTLDGSPMLVADETKNMGDKNAKNIETNAQYSIRSMMLKAEANKQQVKKADIWGTGFSALGSFSKAYDAYGKAKNGG